MRRAAAVGCALVVLACSCSSSNKFPSSNSSPTTVAPETTVPDIAPATTGAPITEPPGLSTPALSSLILSAAPAGFTLQPDAVGDTGPTDLAKATRDDFSNDARQALIQAGFVRGYQRLWRTVDATGTDLDQNFIFLYEFNSAEGAQSFAEHWRQTLLATKGQAALVPFTPAYMPGAIGLSTQDKRGSTGAVIFTKGVYGVEALVNGGPSTDQSGVATQLAIGQYQLLP